MHDQLLGSTQPVLSISLEPGESIIGAAGEFAWMTDSIQMAAGQAGLAAYTAKDSAGTVAFAARMPGSILTIEVTPEHEYLVHHRGFLAATPGIDVSTGFRQRLAGAELSATEEFVLHCVRGRGRAWVDLSGDVVRRELAAGTSLRTHPWHIGMSDASVAVQMASLPDRTAVPPGSTARLFAVLSGPGTVWLQSMPPPPAAGAGVPAVEGAAGPATSYPAGAEPVGGGPNELLPT